MKKSIETDEPVAETLEEITTIPRITTNFQREDLNELRDVVNELYALKK